MTGEQGIVEGLARLPPGVRSQIFRFMRHPVADLVTSELFPKRSIYADVIELFEFICERDRMVDHDDYDRWLYDFEDTFTRRKSYGRKMDEIDVLRSGLWRARSLTLRYVFAIKNLMLGPEYDAALQLANEILWKLGERLALPYVARAVAYWHSVAAMA